MSSLPLVSHVSPDSIIAWRADGAVTLRQFLAEVRQLAALFPAGGHVLNLCRDRYHFSVGLAAAMVVGKVSLLPPADTPEVVRQIKVFAPDVFCLTDNDLCTVDLPQLLYPVMGVSQADAFAIPQIDSKQRIAVLFTSGSTGAPQPHPKTWGALVSDVQAEAARLGLLRNAPCTLIGTVPPQHMYGFEATVLMAWRSGNALSHAQPFYPADICQALAAVPSPRVLVSSPVHLRALLDAGLAHKGYTLHCLRHTFASELLNAGMRLECLQPLLGHSSIEMTRRYARLTDTTRKEEYFRAMAIIEKGGVHGDYRRHHQLP